jgi:CubicO group peptidase (beta-lactamase class C family)
MPATNAAFEQLAAWGEAASLTVVRDGRPIVARASGRTIAGGPVTTATPMVVASVSKLLTEIALARLEQRGVLDLDTPIPWGFLGLDPHPGWADVTARQLIGHAAGMPVVRPSWFTGEGDCRSYLSELMAGPPAGHRGTWTYSNGNFCALGLLVEFVAGRPLDVALGELVFDPAGVGRAHLTSDGQRPDDVLHRRGVARLSRLGAAGNLIVSTDSIAGALARLTPADYAALGWPGGFVDQYGFGYTGTMGGATACAWVLDGGRTVVAATVSGERPATGGAICDLVEPAIGSDLGFWAGRPQRSSI